MSTCLLFGAGTDMLPAIGLAYETKETAIMFRPPRNIHKNFLVDGPLLVFTYLHFGVIQVRRGTAPCVCSPAATPTGARSWSAGCQAQAVDCA